MPAHLERRTGLAKTGFSCLRNLVPRFAVQELAIKLRSEGKDYKEHKKAKKAAAAPVAEKRKAEGGPGKADDGDNKKARHYLGDKTPTWRPFDEVEVSPQAG